MRSKDESGILGKKSSFSSTFVRRRRERLESQFLKRHPIVVSEYTTKTLDFQSFLANPRPDFFPKRRSSCVTPCTVRTLHASPSHSNQPLSRFNNEKRTFERANPLFCTSRAELKGLWLFFGAFNACFASCTRRH